MRSTIRQLVLVAGSLWLVGCATQQPYDGQDALSPQERRMQSVEDKLAVVNRRMDAIDNNMQNSDVSSQVRELRGQIQELQHQQQKSKLTLQNFGQRLQRLESGGAMPPGSSSGASNAGVPAPASAATNAQPTNVPTESAGNSAPTGNNALAGNANNADEQAAYIRSFNLLQAGKMDAAIAGFKDMLNQYPQGNYADNAWYWLGSAYYVKGDSSDALASFKSLLSRFPNSPKVPDALLKTGIIYQDAHKPDQARTAFQRVIGTYPNSNAATLAKQRMAKNSG